MTLNDPSRAYAMQVISIMIASHQLHQNFVFKWISFSFFTDSFSSHTFLFVLWFVFYLLLCKTCFVKEPLSRFLLSRVAQSLVPIKPAMTLPAHSPASGAHKRPRPHFFLSPYAESMGMRATMVLLLAVHAESVG